MFIYHHIKLYLLLFLAGCLEFNVYLVEQDVPGLQVYLQLYLLLVTSWQYVAVHSFYDILRGLLYLLLLRWVTCYQWYNFWPRDHSSSIAGKHFIWPIVCSPPPPLPHFTKNKVHCHFEIPLHTLFEHCGGSVSDYCLLVICVNCFASTLHSFELLWGWTCSTIKSGHEQAP